MKAAAIGLTVHSGWGALVAIAGRHGEGEVLERRKLIIIDPKTAGAAQPYHFVEEMEIRAAEWHLTKCARDSANLALSGLTQVRDALQERGFTVLRSVIVLSAARPLPDLEEILASHALIHTAEGEFFRHAFRSALETLRIPVTGIRACDLEDCSRKAFGKAAAEIQKRVDGMGRIFGAPWTKDEKTAALAAAIVLASAHPKVHATHSYGA
jgi:hypothetical protein